MATFIWSLNIEIIHQMVIIISKFILIQLLPEIIFHLVLVPLKCGDNVGDLCLVNPYGDKEATGRSVRISVQLNDLSIVCLDQLADLGKGEAYLLHFQHDNPARVGYPGNTPKLL